jgi:hypothetical protein
MYREMQNNNYLSKITNIKRASPQLFITKQKLELKNKKFK